ncbi:MAG: formate dehydrogenase accessory sulfurtransferase FdhD [Hyphomicrobiales bacterium]|nr:formate dehydrogenase accessory sulfurtransferase FdhD [Hyphomicrobiales bacterium]
MQPNKPGQGEAPQAGALEVDVRKLAFDRPGAEGGRRAVPDEVPVEIVYPPLPLAVMMLTPGDLEDFACGFSFTEGVIASAVDIRAVAVESVEAGLRLNITLAADRLAQHLGRRRALAGRTGCGLCGIEDLSQLPQAVPVAGRQGPPLARAAIKRALLQLSSEQPLNAATHGVHAAALADAEGRLLLVREDVGRHNALDKLIGAALRAGLAPGDGFVLISSRASYEMVEKTARFGARALVAISAPTALAIARATHYGIGLMAIARHDTATVFAHAAMFS